MGDGRFLAATDILINAVSAYAAIVAENDPALKSAFRKRELEQLAERAVAQTLVEIETEISLTEACDAIKIGVDRRIAEAIDRHKSSSELVLGCQLFVGESIYPIGIGPVLFEERIVWLNRALREERISKITAKRISSVWAGRKIENRKGSNDYLNERAIVETISDCQIICTVTMSGLSSKIVEEKGLLVARLAMTALALTWDSPSKVLQWMHLNYDGSSNLRHYILFGDNGFMGSSSSRTRLPCGKSVDSEWLDIYRKYEGIYLQIGAALRNYVEPAITVDRPRMLKAVFLSLWWFSEACRETSDQMATAKFASSMDALCGGGRSKGIITLIEARLGFKADQAILKDGSTVKSIVSAFYEDSRSRLYHGTSENYSHDWSQIRARAEALGRLCLLRVCEWMEENPQLDDLQAMQSHS